VTTKKHTLSEAQRARLMAELGLEPNGSPMPAAVAAPSVAASVAREAVPSAGSASTGNSIAASLSAALATYASGSIATTGSSKSTPITIKYGHAGYTDTRAEAAILTKESGLADGRDPVLVPAKVVKAAQDSTHHAVPATTGTVEGLLYQLQNGSKEAFNLLRNQLVATGKLSATDNNPIDTIDAYSSVLNQVVTMQAAGQRITPSEYLANLMSFNGIDPSKVTDAADWKPPTVGTFKPTTHTSTSTSVYDLAPEDAKAMLESTLQQTLGRAPSEAEVSDFMNAVNTAAKANPNVTKATETTDASGNTVEHSSSTPGFDQTAAEQMAVDRSMRMPDYASFQAVSTYFPALMSLLGEAANVTE
jgi:hypothetical protein